RPPSLPAAPQPILGGAFEVVYGSRFKGSAAGLSYTHRVANRLLNVTVNVLFNRYLSDVYTGYKVFTRNAFDGLTLTAKTFTVELDLTAHFWRQGLVIYEVPISYRARTYSQGKQLHLSDGLRAAGAALRYRFRPAPKAVGPLSQRAPAHSRGKPPPRGEGWRAAGAPLRYGFRPAPKAVGPLSQRAPDAPGALAATEGRAGALTPLRPQD